MKVYRSLNQFTKLSGDQIGEMIERYVNGEDLNALAEDYNIYLETAKNYIHKHYYGIVPKHRQKTITISSESIKNNFRANFIKERRKLKLSQHQIADQLQINQKTIGSYEEGRALPPLDGIIKIADFFKISVDQLIK